MDLKHSIQRAAVVVGILALISITAVAQENRSEISIQGTGFFTNDTQGNGVQDHTTNTGGFLIGYRYNFNRWLAAEANYGYDRNTQVYLREHASSSPVRHPSNHWRSCGETARFCSDSTIRIGRRRCSGI